MKLLILLIFIFCVPITAVARGNSDHHNEISGRRYNNFWTSNTRDIASQISPEYFGTIGYVGKNMNKKYQSKYYQLATSPLLKGSEKALQKALAFYYKQKNGISVGCGGTQAGKKIKGPWIVVTDYTKPIDQKRQFYINVETNQVIASFAQHGAGSNIPNDKNQYLKACPTEHQVDCGIGFGKACKIPISFDDKSGSHKTQTGFMLAAEPYRSGKSTFQKGAPPSSIGMKNGIRLDGVSKSSRNARSRAVVYHRASYVGKETNNACGFSWGCPSTDPETFENMKEKLQEGTLFYNHTVNEELTVNPSC